MKIISKAAIPDKRIWRYIFHADFECLRKYQSEEWTPELTKKFSRILDDVRIENTWKRTNSGRLTGVSKLLLRNLKKYNYDSITILDLGASDGITTIELQYFLQKEFMDKKVSATIMDKFLGLKVYKKYFLKEYRATTGSPVFLRIWRLGLRLPDSEHKWCIFTNLFSSTYLKFSKFRNSFVESHTISLLNPLVCNNKSVSLVEQDCLKYDAKFHHKFDVIRVSNLLNKQYFSDDQIRLAIENIRKYLKEGGMVAISRNVLSKGIEVEQGSLWKKENEKLILQEEIGEGSEVKYLV
jgi:chemotaxis methyl-accepting protein methylase